MHAYSLTLKAHKRPETVERLLRVIRHRGFEITHLNAESKADEWHLALNVQSARDIRLLTNQLAKLPDVIAVE